MTYEELKEEIMNRLTEGVHNSRWDLIVCYHDVGKLIAEGEKSKVSQVTQLAEDLGKHKRTIYRCHQFIKKFPDLDALPDGKNISWHKIVNKYLPKESKEKADPSAKIAQFIKDIFPGDRRKAFIKEVIEEWEFYRKANQGSK